MKTELRKALGTFATGVTIVTTLTPDKQLVGITANSFSSVSLDPPIVLWSLKKSSPSLEAFDHNGRFVVNVLTENQKDLSTRFASSISDKFSSVLYAKGIDGLPLIDSCAATFQCKTYQRIEAGDHILFLGLVEAFEHHNHPTLMFCKGKYMKGTELE
jgi:flavin reductase (DIM6/NTAB) family NADH-FMN oxidoreductase RutF